MVVHSSLPPRDSSPTNGPGLSDHGSIRSLLAPGTPAPGVHLGLALCWTWLLWGLAAAAAAESGASSPLVLALFSLGGLGPVLIASILVVLGRSQEPLARFWQRVVDPRGLRPRWYGAIAAVAFVPAFAGRLSAGSAIEMQPTPPLLAVLGVALLTALSEEPGWRGYAQEGLQRRWPIVGAALVVGVVWSAWHLPLFFIEGTYQQRVGLGSAASWQFFCSVAALSVIYGWIYAGTDGSTLAVVLAHAGQNVAAALWSAPAWRPVELTLILALALTVSLTDRSRMLSRRRAAG